MSIDKREKILVPIDLGKGMNEAVADEVAGVSSLRRLENVYYDKRGTLKKRDGYATLNSGRLDNTSRTVGYALGTSRKSLLIYDGSTVDVYSPTANTSVSTGFGPQLGLVSTPVAGGTGEAFQYQSVACNGYLLCAYFYAADSGYAGAVKLTVLDEKTLDTVVPETVVFTGSVTFSPNASQMRVAMVGNCAHVVVDDFTTGNVNSSFVDLTSKATITTGLQVGYAATNGVADVHRNVPYSFDAIGDESNLYLVYPGPAGAPRIVRCNSTGSIQDTSAIANTATMLSACITDDSLVVARYWEGNVSVDAILATDVSSTTFQLDNVLDNVGSNVLARCLTVGTTGTNTATVAFANSTATTYRGVTGNSASLTNAINKSQIQNWWVVSRPMVLNGEVYFVAKERSASNANAQGEKTLVGVHVTTSHNLYANAAFVMAPRLSVYGTLSTNFSGTHYYQSAQHTHNTWDGQVAGLFPRQKLSALSGTDDGIAFDYVRFTRDPDEFIINPVVFGDDSVASGGITSTFDGGRVTECGFVSRPLVSFSNSAAGSVTGNVSYVAIYERVTASGSVVWSQPSDPQIVAASSNTINVTVRPIAVTSSTNDDLDTIPPSVAIYRTVNNGSTYYRVGSVRDSGAVQYFNDNTTDTALVSLQKLYTQPGTPGTALGRQCPPASTYSITHQDRVWLVAEDGVTLWYSAPRVQGETAWFNNLFTIPIEDGGKITGLASFDNRLVVFKEGEIFVVDGSGPPENGGSGTEFAPPYKLPFGTGCINPGSIIATSGTLYFRSSTGLEALDRRMQVSWVGEPVRDTLASYPVITSAVAMADDRVVFTCRETNVMTAPGNGVLLVHHTRLGAWSVDLVEGTDGTANYGFIDSATQELDGEYRTFLLDSDGVLYAQRTTDDADRYKDSVDPVRIGLATNWVRSTESLADRQRVWNAEVTLRAKSNTSVNASLAYDYSNTFSDDKQWSETVLGSSGIAVLKKQPETPQNMAVKLLLQETANVANVATGNEEGFEVLGVSFEIAPKSGAHDPAATKKG